MQKTKGKKKENKIPETFFYHQHCTSTTTHKLVSWAHTDISTVHPHPSISALLDNIKNKLWQLSANTDRLYPGLLSLSAIRNLQALPLSPCSSWRCFEGRKKCLCSLKSINGISWERRCILPIFLRTFLAPKTDFDHSDLASEPDMLILCPQKLSFRKIAAEFSPSFLCLLLPPLLPSSLYFSLSSVIW